MATEPRARLVLVLDAPPSAMPRMYALAEDLRKQGAVYHFDIESGAAVGTPCPFCHRSLREEHAAWEEPPHDE